MDVADWLRALGLERYEAAFRENAVDAELLPNLTTDDLKDLGITLVGHRRRLLEAIAGLRSEGTPTADPAGLSTTPAGTLHSSAERRPLSVMFCDLIGSTALVFVHPGEKILHCGIVLPLRILGNLEEGRGHEPDTFVEASRFERHVAQDALTAPR